MLNFTRTDWRILAAAAIAAAVIIIGSTLALGATLAHADVPASTPSVPAHALPAPCGQEDGPAWVWTRCGNHRRGIVTMWGTPVNVTCGTFRYLVRIHDVDTAHVPRLRGDVQCLRTLPKYPRVWAS